MPVTNALDFTSASAADGALKKVKQWMVRGGQPVVATEFNDKPKRTNNMTYREASLTLASGQLITLRVNATGDIFQALLNNSVVPIKNHDDMAKAVGELASLADKNQAAFQKAQARVKVALPPGLSTPKPKIAEVMQQRVTALDNQIADRKATVADLQQKLGAMTDSTGAEPPSLSDAAEDVLRALGARGPLEDGDVPSKAGRDELEALGYIDRYTEQGANVLNVKGRSALDTILAMMDSTLSNGAMMDEMAPYPPSYYEPAATAWLEFKLVNQLYVDEAGPIPLPSRYQVGADVALYVSQGGNKMTMRAKVIGASFRASKVHYTLAVRVLSEGEQAMYAVLHDVDSYYVSSPDMLDSAADLGVLDSLEAFKEPLPDEPATVMPLAGAYVAAREILAADPAMLDSAATAGAVAQLRMALDVVETNYPINVEAGNLEQAQLQKDLAESFKLAIGMLDSAAAAISDAGLAQLVAIAKESAVEDEGITDQAALAELLALGMVETESGLYMVTGKGTNALDDAGYDPYGEPYAAGDD
jgi:ribosomal protein S19E (S16A)